MSTSNQRIILVGFGFMGEMHAQAYAGISNARIVAIVDALPEPAREKTARLKLDAPVFTELSAALAAVEADIVDICLPTDRHASLAVEALEAGKHVFCEKPVALSLEETTRMRAAHAKTPGKFVQVGQCIRFWPEYQAFEKFVRAGTAGKLLSLTLQRRSGRPSYTTGNWINDEARSLGAALDLHIHDTDFVLHLLGTPEAVFSRGTRDATGWSHIFTHYIYPSVAVQAEGGWNYPGTWGFQMAFQAVFERGAIEFDSGATPSLRVTLDGASPEPLPFIPAGGTANGTGGNLSSLGGYANELTYFIDRVSTGLAPEIATLEQAEESLRVTLAEIKSASANGSLERL